jgi:uncharacterized membrane protein YjgN (DUF898 family)
VTPVEEALSACSTPPRSLLLLLLLLLPPLVEAKLLRARTEASSLSSVRFTFARSCKMRWSSRVRDADSVVGCTGRALSHSAARCSTSTPHSASKAHAVRVSFLISPLLVLSLPLPASDDCA